MVPSSSATASASSSTTGPRAVFTSTAVGFISASRRASIRPRVSSCSGTCNETMSATRQQVVEIGDPSGDPGVVARVVQHLHAEPRGAARDRLADAPVADDPERARRARRRRGSRFDAERLSIVPARRSASASDVAARGRQHQEEREVGGGLVEDTGGVAHRDAELGRGGDVDVVVTDRDVGDDPRAAAHRPAARRRRCDR